MKALVLCAGYGTRLGELTRNLPKPMLPIQGEPLLAHTLHYLASYGFKQVAINLHFKPELIKAYFGDGSRFGVQLHYSQEETLLGTAGAIKKLEDYFSDTEDFVVVYGDILTNQDLDALVDFHKARQATATLLLHHRVGSNSIVQMDENQHIVVFIERPTPDQKRRFANPWVNSGIQVLNKRILDFIPKDQPADLPRDVYIPLLTQEPILGFPLSGYRYAIDSPQRYREAEAGMAEAYTASA